MAQLLDASSLARAARPHSLRRVEWRDWRWQLRNAVGSVEELARSLPLTPREVEGARANLLQGLFSRRCLCNLESERSQGDPQRLTN